MKTVFEKMLSLDDALPPISETNLLSADVWAKIEVIRAD